MFTSLQPPADVEPSSGARHLVFVYGSLLAGQANHHRLAGARFVAAAATRPEVELCDLGAYPAMIAGGTQVVSGELYEVDDATLARLDDLEGHPRFYRRTPVTLASGVVAVTYLLPRTRVAGCPRIASGDWRAHLAQQETRA